MKKIIAFICWSEVFLMWFCAASKYLNPAVTHKFISLAGLAFPISVLIVLLTALVCLIIARKQVLILILGLAVCFNSLRDYCPINLTASVPETADLKVLSYNTMSFSSWEKDEDGAFSVSKYLMNENPDIACLQEVSFRKTEDQEAMLKVCEAHGYHYKWTVIGETNMGVLSKFPIVKMDTICQSAGNGAAAFYAVRGEQDTLLIINAHLESMHLSKEDRGQYHAIVKHPAQADTIKGKRTMLRKICNSGVTRAGQADALGKFLDEHAGQQIILTGDFNDTPISYTHHQVCSRLTDAFKTAGNGISRSFNKDAIVVRIDNIFCSSHWTPVYTKVDHTVKYSDHYPIISYLKKNDCP